MMPRQKVAPLAVETLDGQGFDPGEDRPERFSLIVVYRGFHCPLCKLHLTELSRLREEFGSRGVQVIAISTDDRARAEAMAMAVGDPALRFGYGLPFSTARAWGLYLSEGRGVTSISVEEPKLFAEPGIFIVRSDETLYYANIQTMPFARPQFKELLMAIDYAINKNYPARGEYAGSFLSRYRKSKASRDETGAMPDNRNLKG